MGIDLREVTEADAAFLYNLLRERPAEANISHKAMPTFPEHVAFLLSKPYAAWCIASAGGIDIGSAYLTKQNEIGVFLLERFRGKGLGPLVIEALMERHPGSRFLANIAPKNEASRRVFESLGFKLIQQTYEREGRE